MKIWRKIIKQWDLLAWIPIILIGAALYMEVHDMVASAPERQSVTVASPHASASPVTRKQQ
jgi:hypothetical protein